MSDLVELEKRIGTGRVLLVNSTMEARAVITWQNAVPLIFENKAYVLMARSDGSQLRSPSITVDMPLVISLVKYAQRYNGVYDVEDKATKAHIRKRDRFTCAYCGKYGDTVDHIQPKSRGGLDTWGNLVTACKLCNGIKRDRTPEEAGMVRPRILSGVVNDDRLMEIQSLFYSAMETV